MNGLGYVYKPDNWGPGSGMPEGGILPVTAPGSVWGWEEVLRRFGTLSLKQALQARGRVCGDRLSRVRGRRLEWELPNALPPDPGNPRGCLHTA
jgi:gamma-glutamyltranspeptidase/glutathione hydrolase